MGHADPSGTEAVEPAASRQQWLAIDGRNARALLPGLHLFPKQAAS
jgi:hypothetical protein